jgi:hypothetical protein
VLYMKDEQPMVDLSFLTMTFVQHGPEGPYYSEEYGAYELTCRLPLWTVGLVRLYSRSPGDHVSDREAASIPAREITAREALADMQRVTHR